jgi:putative spermidine/putrescine transport system substrate-binding protein
MKYPYGVGHIYSGKVAVFNPKLVAPAPVSYKDVFAPKHGNKLGIIDIQYQYTIAAAALAAGGSITNFEPGKKLLLECKKAGMRIYPTNEAFAQGLQSGEFGIGVMWKARVVQWQNAGISVEAVAPSEGTLAYISGFVIPKNAPNKDGAYAYLDDRHGLQPDGHECRRRPGTQQADRFHARRNQEDRRSRLRLHEQERRRPQGMVGQGTEGLIG